MNVTKKYKDTKLYIGTKQVEARPMSLGEFIKYSDRNPYATLAFLEGRDKPAPGEPAHDVNEEGYLVRYSDSYESWSPKEQFEAAYRVADTPLDRLKIEVADLRNRAVKTANAFYGNGELTHRSAILLHKQLDTMAMYIAILEERISDLEKEQESKTPKE